MPHRVLLPNNGNSNQQHHNQTSSSRRSSNNNINSRFKLRHRHRPTVWIGVSMFCLVIVYVIVVLVVAKRHLQTTSVTSSSSSSSSLTNRMVEQIYQDWNVSQTIQQKVQAAMTKRLKQAQPTQPPLLKQQPPKDKVEDEDEDPSVDQLMKQLDQVLDPLLGDENETANADGDDVDIADDDDDNVDKKGEPLNKKKDKDDDDDEHEEAEDKQDEEMVKEHQKANRNNQAPLREEKSHKQEEENNNKDDDDNPYRQKEKVRGIFGHGVAPQVLLPQDSTDLQLTASVAADDNKQAFDSHPTPQYILQAYMETVDFEEWQDKPLPTRRNAQQSQLKHVSYPRVSSCRNLIAQFPVDDTPTDKDPFLPWIHDVFPTADGKFIQFVAQNKRRCKTGSTTEERDILMFMQPQAALFQHVPVKRVQMKDYNSNNNNNNGRPSPRYQLVPYEQADADGMVTRFICRFKPSMEETLSVFNFDYDWTSLRKRYKVAFNKDEGGIKSIHTTQLLFKCPVPEQLQETIRTGAAVQNDWTSLFVDVIPIRTPPRYGAPNQFLAPWYQEGFQATGADAFQPKEEWGDNHVLPRIEDSGRWENIPICKPSLMEWEGATVADLPATKNDPIPKKHHLVSCLWVSAGYATRGNRFAINDGQRRLLEWITHNKNIGFDHFYIFDNTGAFRNDTSLKPIADLFPGETTWIPWPSKVCNNNPNNVDSPGERSSQYAAESSCRLRFGQHVEWIGQFDIDEYLVPMGDHKTATSLLAKLDKEDTKIISFPSWRAWPRWAHIGPIDRIQDKSICWSNEPCFHLTIPLSTTMLQAYNCDRQLPGQKSKSMPAEKQIYKSDYVVQHFVHYSAATVLSELNRTEYEKQFAWSGRGFPDKRQRFANEVTEGLMIHTKAVATQDTSGWERVCHVDIFREPNLRRRGLCRLGVPWPADPGLIKQNGTEEGWAYNCYVNRKVEEYFVPRLNAGLSKHLDFFESPQ